ncbi:MAG: protein translocase subunit SecD [Lachnospiraceae bacterium]|nr:protein translocase subunit SecD [Lachnospiraceae bacterium]
MKKRTSIVTLILCLVITVLLGFTAVVGWGPTGTGAMKNIRTGLDLSGGVSITYQTVEENPSSEDMADTIYKLQQRVDQYSTEAQVYQQGDNRISVEIPGVSDANTILEELGKPGSLYFMDENGETVLEGTDIASAEGVSTSDSTTGQREYLVSLTMTSEGADKFAEATTANVGKVIYIVYDGEIISSPTVRSAITGGSAQIDGMSSLEEAKNLAANIRIGSLSLELEEIYSNVVGATLGQEALSTSLYAGLIGVLLVILFMIVVYRISGLAAGWALIIFVFLDLIFLNAFDVTLTLTGIAGVILTIGMAVDANVIIYARMREEYALGRSLKGSIQSGFQKAFSAIVDGNVTTLIAAAVLYLLGTGSIRGFATTLAIGIILSMFSALVVSRLLSMAFYGIGIRSEKAYGILKPRKPVNFLQKRAVFFILSLVLIVSAPVGMAVYNGSTGQPLNYSLDFIGGTATTVDFHEEFSLSELDEQVQPVVSEITGDANIQFQQVTSSTQVVIKTRELSVEEREALNQAIMDNYSDVTAEDITAENISSTISGEMKANATKAVVIAVICMLLYIWIRFRDLRFASSSVLALVHDILIVLVFYVWSRFSVGSTFIAVMLTILGYSINATIVVFDRIRENMHVMKGDSLKNIVNTSVTQTLTRSIYSSLTTFITIFVLYLMGVPSIKEFALPIIIGIITGAYSSVCLAGSLWYILKTKVGKNRVKDAEGIEDKAAPAAAAADTSASAAGGSSAGAGSSKKHVKKDRSELQSTKRKKHRR